MRDAVGKLRDLFGLPPDFLGTLISEDDWSFVIKLHAFVESALTWSLEVHLQSVKLESFIARCDLSGGRTSKVECAISIGTVESDDVRFIRGLSKIRNRLAHNIRNVSFDLKKYLQAMSADEQGDFLTNAAAHFWEDSLSKAEKEVKKQEILSEPKKFLFWSAIQLIAFLVIRVDVFRLERELDATKRELLEEQLAHARLMLEDLKKESKA